MYRINIHAHTIFSDGSNSPLGMAQRAEKCGFSALVITDHYYPTMPKEWCSAGAKRHKLIRRACEEVKPIMPVIVGMEMAFGKEEILVFGSAMIQAVHRHCDQGNSLSVELLEKWKRRFDCAFILCHPCDSEYWPPLLPILDGYERYNSGQDMFPDGRELSCLSDLPSWCNSDAHHADGLPLAFNLVDTKIETESDLIRYIKRGKQPEPFLALN